MSFDFWNFLKKFEICNFISHFLKKIKFGLNFKSDSNFQGEICKFISLSPDSPLDGEQWWSVGSNVACLSGLVICGAHLAQQQGEDAKDEDQPGLGPSRCWALLGVVAAGCVLHFFCVLSDLSCLSTRECVNVNSQGATAAEWTHSRPFIVRPRPNRPALVLPMDALCSAGLFPLDIDAARAEAMEWEI